MQRRHFELIAATIKAGKSPPEVRKAIAMDFASALALTNPGFNRDKFLSACGVKVYP